MNAFILHTHYYSGLTATSHYVNINLRERKMLPLSSDHADARLLPQGWGEARERLGRGWGDSNNLTCFVFVDKLIVMVKQQGI